MGRQHIIQSLLSSSLSFFSLFFFLFSSWWWLTGPIFLACYESLLVNLMRGNTSHLYFNDLFIRLFVDALYAETNVMIVGPEFPPKIYNQIVKKPLYAKSLSSGLWIIKFTVTNCHQPHSPIQFWLWLPFERWSLWNSVYPHLFQRVKYINLLVFSHPSLSVNFMR